MRPLDPAGVENLFNNIAYRYDLLNDLLSFGLHRLWKRQLLHSLRPSPGEDWVDICCGTGDLSLSLARSVFPGGSVTGIDVAEKPLALAKKKALSKPSLSITLIKGDALDTGLPSDSFDGGVMAYGLRNLESPLAAFIELRRLLKPGARAGILDFNKTAEGSFSRYFQNNYLRYVVVPVANKFGLQKYYDYLAESLIDFPNATAQEKLAIEAGFLKANYRNTAGGQMGALFLQT